MDSDPYIQALFGQHAMRAACQIVLQKAGRLYGEEPDTLFRYGASVVLASTHELMSAEALARGDQQELIVGDVIIRPFGKWSDNRRWGRGLGSFFIDGSLFPEDWEHMNLDNGYSAMREKAEVRLSRYASW